MAEIKTGIFAKNVQKRLNRAQEKVLQKLGKADETKDEQFEQVVINFRRQESEGARLQREMKAYMAAIKGMQQASINLTQSLHEVYEPDWHGKDDVMVIGKDCDAMWEDFHNKLVDSTLLNLDEYLLQFPDLKTRVAKRSRKLIDYDSARHHMETLQVAGMKNDRKVMKVSQLKVQMLAATCSAAVHLVKLTCFSLKAEEELKKAQKVFDELNVGLQDELPTLWDSRVGFYISTYKSITKLEAKFHREISLVCRQLYEVMTKLAEQHSDKMFTIQGAPSDSGPLRLARTPSPPDSESPPDSPDASSNHMLRPVSPGPPRPKSPIQLKKGPPVPPPPKVTPTKEVAEEQIIDLFGGEFLPAPSPSQPNERPGQSLLDMDFDAFQPDESVSPIPQTAVPWDMWSANAQTAEPAADTGFVANWSADFGSLSANGDAAAVAEAPAVGPEGAVGGAQDWAQDGVQDGAQADGWQDGAQADGWQPAADTATPLQDREAATTSEDEVRGWNSETNSNVHPSAFRGDKDETGQANSEGDASWQEDRRKSTPGLIFTNEYGEEIEHSTEDRADKWYRSPDGSGSEYETAEEWADGGQVGGWASADDELSYDNRPPGKVSDGLGCDDCGAAEQSQTVEHASSEGNKSDRNCSAEEELPGKPTDLTSVYTDRSENQEEGVFDSDPFTEKQGGSAFDSDPFAEKQEGGAFDSDPFAEKQGGAFDSDPFAEKKGGGAFDSDPFTEKQGEGAFDSDPFAEKQGGVFDSDPFAEKKGGGAFDSDPFTEKQGEGVFDSDPFAESQGGAFDSDPFAEKQGGGVFDSDPFAEKQGGAFNLDPFAENQGGAFDSDSFAEKQGGVFDSDPFAEKQGGAFDSDPFAEKQGGAFDSDPFAETQFGDKEGGFGFDPFAETSGEGAVVSTGDGRSGWDSDPFANSFPAASSGTEGRATNTTSWQEVSHSSGFESPVPQQNSASADVSGTAEGIKDLNVTRIHKEPENSDMSEDEAANRRFGKLYPDLDTEKEEDATAPSFFADFDKMNEVNPESTEAPETSETEAAEVQDKPATPPAGEKMEEPAPPSAVEKMEDPATPPAGEKMEEPAPPSAVEKIDGPAAPPAEEKIDELAAPPAEEKIEKPASPPAEEKIDEPASPPAGEKIDEPASPPAEEKLDEPAVPPAGEKIVESATPTVGEEDSAEISCSLKEKPDSMVGSPDSEKAELSEIPPVDDDKPSPGEAAPSEKMPIPSVVIEPASSNEGDDDRDADIISPTAISDNGVTAIKHMSPSGGVMGLPDDFLYKVETMHDFEAANSDELELKRGDVVLVVPTASVEDQEAGWLTGFKESEWLTLGTSAHKGLFPENFTQRLE
ncbi:amphiphysin isoform X3 [Perca fluviatilis]|uniref:amphiphysin isoform X3 n=1 Tax=Perca fluviatilis TaxID=8168 RepID=UPI001966AA09|nr:amphiphysin isoform X3 [Perca fluviatilis]